ncbi:MAG: hypothetical protein WCK67_05785 [bacterium]
MHFSGRVGFKSINDESLSENHNEADNENILQRLSSNKVKNNEADKQLIIQNTRDLNTLISKRLEFILNEPEPESYNDEIKNIQETKKLFNATINDKNECSSINFKGTKTRNEKAVSFTNLGHGLKMAMLMYTPSWDLGTKTRDDKADFLINGHSALASGVAAACSPVPFSDLGPLAANTFIMCLRLAQLYEAEPTAAALYASQAIAQSQATGYVAFKTANSALGWAADSVGGMGLGNGAAAAINSTIAFNVTKGCGNTMKGKLEKGEVTLMNVIGTELMSLGFSAAISNFDKFSNIINALSDEQVKAFFCACPRELYTSIATAGDILRYNILPECDKEQIARAMTNISSTLLDKINATKNGSNRKASSEESEDAKNLKKALDKLATVNLPEEDKKHYMNVIKRWNVKYNSSN